MKQKFMIIAIVFISMILISGCIKGPEEELIDRDRQEQEQPEIIEEETPKPTEEQRGTIAIFVDDNTYNQLTDEIDRFKSDIISEQNANVKIYHESYSLNLKPDPQVTEIREILEELYASEELVEPYL